MYFEWQAGCSKTNNDLTVIIFSSLIDKPFRKAERPRHGDRQTESADKEKQTEAKLHNEQTTHNMI